MHFQTPFSLVASCLSRFSQSQFIQNEVELDLVFCKQTSTLLIYWHIPKNYTFCSFCIKFRKYCRYLIVFSIEKLMLLADIMQESIRMQNVKLLTKRISGRWSDIFMAPFNLYPNQRWQTRKSRKSQFPSFSSFKV